MSLASSFWTWLQNTMLGSGTVTITDSDLAAFIQQNKPNALSETEFLLEAGIRMIAGAVANCRFQTFKKDKEEYGSESWLWNYEPNNNQNAPEFIHKMIWMMIHNNECLIVADSSGKIHIADSYTRYENHLYQDIFSDVTLDVSPGSQGEPFTFKRNFMMQDVIFLKLNNRNLSDLLAAITSQYASLLESALKAFDISVGEHGILYVNAQAPQRSYGTKSDGTPRTFNDVYNDMMTKQFKSYFENTNAVMTLFDGFEYKPSASSGSTADSFESIKAISDQSISRVATALGIPPVLFKGEVANDGNATDTMLSFAVMPYVRLIEAEINRKKYGRSSIARGTYLHIDTSRIKYVDPFSVATPAYNLVGMGYSTDEIRRKLGDAPTGEEWSKKHILSKNFDDPGGDNTRIDTVEKSEKGGNEDVQ